MHERFIKLRYRSDPSLSNPNPSRNAYKLRGNCRNRFVRIHRSVHRYFYGVLHLPALLRLQILLLTLVLNCVFCLLFASSYNIYLLYLSRIGMGFSQAFCVFTPRSGPIASHPPTSQQGGWDCCSAQYPWVWS